MEGAGESLRPLICKPSLCNTSLRNWLVAIAAASFEEFGIAIFIHPDDWRALGDAVIGVVWRRVDCDAAQAVVARVAEDIFRRAADLAGAGPRRSIAANRHIHLIADRIGRHRMRAG